MKKSKFQHEKMLLEGLPIEICLSRNMRERNAILVVAVECDDADDDDDEFFFLFAILVIFQSI